MGPAHWAFGVSAGRRRKTIESRLAPAVGSLRAVMPRNAEVIRQWTILRDLEVVAAADDRRHGRADRRDDADDPPRSRGAAAVGFPLFDESHDGKKYWMLEQRAFRRLDETGFTFAELSALYFSRTLVECLAATPFQHDVASAFDKLAAALTPGMRQFLDRLPLVIQAKAEPARHRRRPRARKESPSCSTPRCITAASIMRYHSFSSNREKEYMIEPYRLVFAQGGLYVVAFVPEYGQLRTFAVDRISRCRSPKSGSSRSTPRGGVRALARRPPGRARAHRDRVRAADRPLRRERLWHASQEIATRATDGTS